MAEGSREQDHADACTHPDGSPAHAVSGEDEPAGALLAPPVATGIAFLDRTFTLLRLLGEQGPTTPGELVRSSGLARPTVHRILSALTALDLVVRERRGQYRLGLSLVGWGHAALAALGTWIEPAEALLSELRRETGARVELYLREGDWRICALSLGGEFRAREAQPVGLLQRLTTGSSGQVLLAWSDDVHRFPGADLQLLAAVRQRGWASTAGPPPGGAELSVPILVPRGQPRAAICVSGLDPRRGLEPSTRLATRVAEAAREIEELIARRHHAAD